MKILINTLGIQDSGGITVLDKVLDECSRYTIDDYLIVCHDNTNIDSVVSKYIHYKHLKFEMVQPKGFLYRLYLENIIFRQIIKRYNIDLVYNFSGSAQIFSKVPQLIKIHNLLFYTKKLDDIYKKKHKYISWLKQIYFKRIVFATMIKYHKYFEIQSPHVKDYMRDFIDTRDKKFYIKSDIDISDDIFSIPKRYDFAKKIKFLYIVGPHFEYIHKNFHDFTDAMLKLNKQNIDFEINITLTQEQLFKSALWDNSLNCKTNFLGYVSDRQKMKELFADNTILISTSIIETLGLHIIESIKNGIVNIAPDELYSRAVYGEKIIKYDLFNTKSLLKAILNIIQDKIDCKEYILTLQNDLKVNENTKYKSIVDIFEKVKNV